MASPVEQRMAAPRDLLAPFATAPGRGGGAPDPPRKMGAALQQRMAAHREWAASSDLALASARSLAHQNFSRQEQLKGLRGRFRELESQRTEALSVRLRKESKHKVTTESMSNIAAINELLNSSVTDLRNRRDKRTSVISDQLQALEPLEAKCNEGAALIKKIEEAVSWYGKSLGFQVVVGEGAKFVFNRIDPQSPEKEYSFCIKFERDGYNLLQCDPRIKGIEELVRDLNLSDDLVKFVRIVREKFQSCAVNGSLAVRPAVGPDVCAAPFPSPVVTSGNGRGEDVPSQSHSRSKNKGQSLPAKRRATALSAASPGSRRRSPVY